MDIKSIIDNFDFNDPDNIEYLNKFKETLVKYKGNGWNKLPSELILQWLWMNKMFYLGYDEDIYELKNDISCRKYIDPLINDEELNKFPEHQYFKNKVRELDDVFKEMTFEYEPFKGGYYSLGKYYERSWWEVRILKYASSDYISGLGGLDLEIEPSKEPNKNYPSTPFFHIKKNK